MTQHTDSEGRKIHICDLCGQWFVPYRRNHRFCSASCRVKACQQKAGQVEIIVKSKMGKDLLDVELVRVEVGGREVEATVRLL